MTNVAEKSRITYAARLAGVLYLVLAVCGAFAEFAIRQRFTVPGDAAATAENILANAGMFRFGIGVELFGQVAFVLLVLALFDLLKVVNRKRAVFMVALVLIAVTITCVNMVNQFGALLVLQGGVSLGAVGTAGQADLAMLFLDLHSVGYKVVAQVFFGLWLVPLGMLIWASGFIPRFVGALLIVAAAGYLADVVLAIFAPGFGVVISEFTFLGEPLLLLWLLIRGVNAEAWLRASRTDRDLAAAEWERAGGAPAVAPAV